jgi:hypothetical protein
MNIVCHPQLVQLPNVGRLQGDPALSLYRIHLYHPGHLTTKGCLYRQ